MLFRVWVLPLTLSAALFAEPCFAKTPSIPPEIQAHADAVTEAHYASVPEERRETQRRLSPTEPHNITPFEINGDGVPDWRVEYSLAAMCGTGGCTNEIHVSRPGGGFDLALRRQFLTMKLHRGETGAALLRLSVHGGNCASDSETECILGFRWDQTTRRFVDAMLSGTASRRYRFSMVEADEASSVPPMLLSALRDAEVVCRRHHRSAKPSRLEADRVVDFDGDGRVDWLVGQGATCSTDGVEEGPGVPVTLWLDRDGGPQKVASVATGFVFLDISNRHPVLASDCRSADEGCKEEAFVWDPAMRTARRIEPAHLEPADAAFLSEWITRLKPAASAPSNPSPEVIARASALVAALERGAAPTDFILARARLVEGAMLTLAGQSGGLEPLRRAVRQLAYQASDDDDAFRLASLYRSRAARGTDYADDRYYGARDAAFLNNGEAPLDGISLRGIELAIEEGFRSDYLIVVDRNGFDAARKAGLGASPSAWIEPGIIDAFDAELARDERRYPDAAAIEAASLDRLSGSESAAAATLHAGLAKSLLALGRLAEAEDHARSAARLRVALAGPNETEVMAAHSDLAGLLLSVRQTSEAEAILRQTVAALRDRSGDNFELATALRRLAEGGLDTGRLRDAAALLESARIEEDRLRARDVVDPTYDLDETPRLLARAHLALGDMDKGTAEFADLVTGQNYVANVRITSLAILLDAIEFGGPAFSAEQRVAIALDLDAAGSQSKDIAGRAVEIAERVLPSGHPWIARAHRLLARALVDADDPGAEVALVTALTLAGAQQEDGRLGGMEIRNEAARYYLARGEEGDAALALRFAREAVAIARLRRAALGGAADTLMADPELRRAFIGLAAAAAAEQGWTGRLDAALADEAFRALQDSERSQATAAMRGNVLRSLAEASKDKNILPLFLEFRRAQRDFEALGQLYLAALITQTGHDVSALLARQSAVRETMAKADARLRTALPRYAELASEDPLPLAEALNRLGPRQGIYLLGGDGRDLVAMLVSAAGPRLIFVRDGAPALSNDSARLRCMLDKTFCTEADFSAIDADLLRAAYPLDAMDPFDLSAASRIGEAILSPLAGGLDGLETLYAVQQGRTAELPLAVVPLARASTDDIFDPSRMAGVRWLIDRVAVVQLPSVNILASAPAVRGGTALGPFLGIGNPTLFGKRPASSGLGSLIAPLSAQGDYLADVGAIAALQPLPGTQRELEGLVRAMGASQTSLITGASATETRVKDDRRLAKADMITFATHGLLPGNLDGLSEPGLVLTPPVQASMRDDGLLVASEVAQFNLSARLVLLSACNTASASGAPGADSLSALARAFLVAGAETVIASRWSVLDDATAALSSVMAARQATNPALTPAGALREAMIAVRVGRTADGTSVPGWRESWKHPRAWGPFILVASQD